MKFCFSLFVALYFLISVSISFAEKGYPETVQSIQIKSSADGIVQNALYFSPKLDREVPLLVALHTWSSDWKNTHNVPLAEGCIERGWAFIHPDFRGPNRRPEACGSDLAVSDIIDAVTWVQKKTKFSFLAAT